MLHVKSEEYAYSEIKKRLEAAAPSKDKKIASTDRAFDRVIGLKRVK